MKKDPWKNRTDRMHCCTCIYFVRKVRVKDESPATGKVGRCRRHAPSMNGFPVVFENDWFGLGEIYLGR